MDYRTIYIFDVISLAVYAVAISILAIRNKNIRGMGWFATAMLLDVGKTGLQAMRGHAPAYATVMLANELNILSFLAMYLGYRWFVVREPLRGRVWRAAIAGTMVLYAALFVAHVPYTFALAIAPVLVLCGLAVQMLLGERAAEFRTVSIVAAVVLCLHIAVVAYRLTVTLMFYGTPASSALRGDDPRLLYTMLGIMLLNACLVMTYVWFYVAQIQMKLSWYAQTDSLTGLLNRRALGIEADRAMSLCERGLGSTVLMAIDMDNFRDVNDRFGHRGGDVALRELAQLMKHELRLVDLIARTGGDEFVVLLPDINLAAAVKVGERLRMAVAQSRTRFDDRVIEMTISVGMSEFSPIDGTWHAAMGRADRALYKCKKAGRNGVVLDREVPALLPVSLDQLGP